MISQALTLRATWTAPSLATSAGCATTCLLSLAFMQCGVALCHILDLSICQATASHNQLPYVVQDPLGLGANEERLK